MKLRQVAGLWSPVVAYLGLIWFLSSQGSVAGAERVWDKLLHFTAYAVLALLVLRACHAGFGNPLRKTAVLAALAISLGYGALDELHQSFVPGRFAAVSDWIADAVGTLFALLLASVTVHRPIRPPASEREPGE